jgi:hypothetical protein
MNGWMDWFIHGERLYEGYNDETVVSTLCRPMRDGGGCESLVIVK